MKNTSWLVLLLALALLGLCGCGKKTEGPITPQVNGVTVDVPKLQQAFTNASPEISSDLAQVGFGVRYGDYMKCLAALDKLANNPSTTEAQKKVVNDVIEQVKKVLAQAPAPAPAAQ